MVNPGGLEPPAAGLKVPCPADPGFTLGVRDPAFVCRDCSLLCLVHAGGTAPPLRRLSAAAVASPAHVRCVAWCSVEDSNPGCRCVGPMPLAAWRTERGSGGGIRTRTEASFEEADSANWSTPPWVGAPGAIRTRTSCGLNAVTPASWSTGAFLMKIGAPCMDSNPRPAPYRGAALPTELTELF